MFIKKKNSDNELKKCVYILSSLVRNTFHGTKKFNELKRWKEE